MSFGKTVPKNVFESRLAAYGWYNSDPAALRSELEGYLANVEKKGLKDISALILPHAGYRYSGQTAAYGISELAGKHFDRVVVMGPSHSAYLQNSLSVPDVTHYATPLGEVALDLKFIKKLLDSPYISSIPEMHESEHSVQIQIPFLQVGLKEFKLVPIVVGHLDTNATLKIAGTIVDLLDDKTLVVISSDFVHYGSRFGYVPFRDMIPEKLKNLDMGAWEFIKRKDLQGFSNYCLETKATICGREPISLLLAMLSKDAEVTLLEYTTSGQLTGDWLNSVSYIAAAFSGGWSAKEKNKKNEEEDKMEILTVRDKQELLKLARNTVEYYFMNRAKPVPQQFNVKLTSGMKEIMGAFVTIKKNGQLRGCIGEIMPKQALYKAAIDQAVNAAVNDYRFSPVQPEELSHLEFEISALTAPRPVGSYTDIILGKHGIILEKNGHSAVFLPQVALEQGWTLEQTLSHLSSKAGLASDAWKNGTKFFVFEAIVFHE